MRAGWRQHEYQIPTGHPDDMAKWTGASSLNRLVDMALYAHDDWFAVATLDLATTTEGETTAHVIAQALKGSGVQVTRLARGVPVGSELEYVDLGTIAHALVDRR